MASRLDEFAPVEAISDEERRVLIRAIVATDLDEFAEGAVRELEEQQRTFEALQVAVEAFCRI